ncbi:hypothetical protein TNCV_2933221 [Trichonephila clavipes]|nr:hypothetical protein TNCV_2933221 [Trichonephila clavipes]
MRAHDRLVVKVSDRGWRVTSSSRVPLQTHRVGGQCTLNMLRAQTSSRWWGVVVRRGWSASQVGPALTMVQNYEVRRQKPSCI